ncbi:MAG: PAS domain S-box protein [Flavobacteriales bacterium]
MGTTLEHYQILLDIYPDDLITDVTGHIGLQGKNWSAFSGTATDVFELFQGEEIEIRNSLDTIASGKDSRIITVARQGHFYNLEFKPLKDGFIYLKVKEQTFASDKYKLLFENNKAAVFRTSMNGDILEINQAYADVFGFETIAELKQRKSYEFYPNPEARKEYVDQLREKGSLTNYLIQNTNKRGELIWLLANTSLLTLGNEEFIEGTLVDITRQIEAENRLKNQNTELQKLRVILENISDAVQVTDETGHMVYVNKMARQRLGVTEDEIKKLHIFDISPYLKSIGDLKAHMDEIAEKGTMVVVSNHVNQTTGELFQTELSIHLEIILGNRYLIATGRDISQRLKDQALLEEKNNYIRNLNEAINSSSLVSITDKKGTIIEVNDKFCEVSQYTREELIGANHNLVSSQHHSPAFWYSFYTTIHSGKTWFGDIRNRKKNGDLYWVRSVIYPVLDENGQPEKFMSIRQDITSSKEADQIIQKHISFQDLLMSIALKLLNVQPEMLDNEISSALEEIGEFVGADRAYIFDYNLEDQTSSNLYEWCRTGIAPQIDNLQKVPLSKMPDWTRVHFSGETMDLPVVSQLPDTILKRLLDEQGIKSLLAIPLMDESNCTGFIGFDSVLDVHAYSVDDKKILELFSEMLVNIGKQIQSINSIELANKKISELNTFLQKRVDEEVLKSEQLSQSFAELDKLAMIGELTSGIAHDLNTPLGAIKVGAESVRYTLEDLFKKVISGVSVKQINYACSRASVENHSMFVGGLQTMRETKSLTEYLDLHYPALPNKDALISALIKARITAEDPEVIHDVLSSDNPEAFTDLIYHIQAIRTFVDTIIEANEKAGSVVKSLRFYALEGATEEMERIDLKDNILTVVNVFNHLILNNQIEFKLDLPEAIFITGRQNKLYQVWSNLIKNAIEATGVHGNISVSVQETSEHYLVQVSNTGEAIPQDLQKKIWQKFFSTKSSHGTGLGLSIVKRILDELDASIELRSEDNLTTFTVTFQK